MVEKFNLENELISLGKQISSMIFRHPNEPVAREAKNIFDRIQEEWNGYYVSYVRLLDVICRA